MRPFHTWLIFSLCVALATLGMGWVSLIALRLDQAEAQARRQAAHEENVRLALWRMDSELALLVAQETARPYFHYTAFYPAGRAYTQMFTETGPNEVRLPSPLLTMESTDILVHFQIGPDGVLTSPQAPLGAARNLALAGYVDAAKTDAAQQRLHSLRPRLHRDELVAMLPEPVLPPVMSIGQSAAQPAQQAAAPQQQRQMEQSLQPPVYATKGGKGNPQLQQQAAKNTMEFNRRQEVAQSYQQIALGNMGGVNGPACVDCPPIGEGLMQALWVNDRLLLVRRVTVNGADYIQGCLLNWSGIANRLLEGSRDLLPDAQLLPAGTEPETQPWLRLQALPARLVPGPPGDDPFPLTSPIRVSLAVAWTCALLAMVAVGALLLGVLSLSERRGAFVSAVTHELRTPLTTLRMYAEMLAEGMVPNESRRRDYLQTLRAEADRLGHLVENVLAYARIERGRARGQVVTLPVEDLLERVRGRLAERAEQAGMKLVVAPADQAAVRADPSAVEQILFNLVDNACKYAASAADRNIHLDAGRLNGRVAIRVRDAGSGIGETARRRLFRPFCKSAHDAANSAPGVGLGLALSRRLAREMGGDLCLEENGQPGAAFLLTLPPA